MATKVIVPRSYAEVRRRGMFIAAARAQRGYEMMDAFRHSSINPKVK